jgi:hypothetical protein
MEQHVLTLTSFDTVLALHGAEPIVPKIRTKAERQKIYQYTPYPKSKEHPDVEFPPHLNIIPKGDQNKLDEIFDHRPQGYCRGHVCILCS